MARRRSTQLAREADWAVRATISGTILPEDVNADGSLRVAVGRLGFLALGQEARPDAHQATLYRDAAWVAAQSWAVALSDGQRGTLPSSYTYGVTELKPQAARVAQLASANKAPALGKLPRGRRKNKGA